MLSRLPVCRRVALCAICILASLASSISAQEKVKKENLTIEEANAEISLAVDQGLDLTRLDVKSDGRQPKYSLEFESRPGSFSSYLTASPQKFAEMQDVVNKRGGMIFRQAKGFVVDGKIYFAILIEVTGPPGTPVPKSKAFFNISAMAYRELVDREHGSGGKLVDTSTYHPPNAGVFHTAVFLPQQ